MSQTLHSETTAGVARTGRFNGGIERKQVGLVCYV